MKLPVKNIHAAMFIHDEDWDRYRATLENYRYRQHYTVEAPDDRYLKMFGIGGGDQIYIAEFSLLQTGDVLAGVFVGENEVQLYRVSQYRKKTKSGRENLYYKLIDKDNNARTYYELNFNKKFLLAGRVVGYGKHL